MKLRNIIYMLFAFVAGLGMFSCSEENAANDPGVIDEDDVPVYVDLGTRALPDNLQCKMYVFSKSANNNNYILKDILALTGGHYKAKLMNSDLANNQYRFLFLATPKDNPELDLLNKDENEPAKGDEWNDVFIRSKNAVLSTNNYYTIIDKAGSAIIDSATIRATLTRLVGQVVLDITKVKESLSTPIGIDPGGVDSIKSVLDRVFKIDVMYTGITKDIAFDSDNNRIIKDTVWYNSPDILLNDTLDNNLRLGIPVTDRGLLLSGWGTKGSVRIMGPCFLPSDASLSIKYIFHYYDTSPACGSPSHVHTIDCYDKRNVVLNLPKEGNTSGLLSIIPDHYTLSKAGIRYNRIIDYIQDGSFGFVTDWNNSNVRNSD